MLQFASLHPVVEIHVSYSYHLCGCNILSVSDIIRLVKLEYLKEFGGKPLLSGYPGAGSLNEVFMLQISVFRELQ